MVSEQYDHVAALNRLAIFAAADITQRTSVAVATKFTHSSSKDLGDELLAHRKGSASA